jgi:hypothetical protein
MFKEEGWNSRDRWQTATDRLKPEELRRIVRQTENLAGIIKRLRHTALVHSLAVSGQMEHGDLLHWRCNLDEKFRTLLKLPKLAKSVGPRARPDFNETLDRLTAYVKAQWHHPMFKAIEEVLNGLGISVNLRQRKYDRRRLRKT